jgi:hypothetical protein
MRRRSELTLELTVLDPLKAKQQLLVKQCGDPAHVVSCGMCVVRASRTRVLAALTARARLKLLIDEHYANEIAAELRAAGHDARPSRSGKSGASPTTTA